MSSVEAKKIVVHEPALGPGWHETIGLLIENMDPDACFQWALFDRPPMTRWSVGRVTPGSPSQNLTPTGTHYFVDPPQPLAWARVNLPSQITLFAARQDQDLRVEV